MNQLGDWPAHGLGGAIAEHRLGGRIEFQRLTLGIDRHNRIEGDVQHCRLAGFAFAQCVGRHFHGRDVAGDL